MKYADQEFILVKMNEESSHNSSQSSRIIKCLCLSSHQEIKPETLTETFHQKQIHSCFALYIYAYYTNCASSCKELQVQYTIIAFKEEYSLLKIGDALEKKG